MTSQMLAESPDGATDPLSPDIRLERASDQDAIDALLEDSFGGQDERVLMTRLRAEDELIFVLVAELEGVLGGVIAFSRLPIVGERMLEGAALAPLAVDRQRRGRGVGTALIRVGLAQCRRRGVHAVCVLGYPQLYARAGFSAEAAAKIRAPWSGSNFLAIALADAPDGLSGEARYPAALAPAPRG